MTDDEFLQQFESQTLPHEQWTHRAHLRVACLYLSRWPFDEALMHMRNSIRAHNAANQVPDTPSRGYHETLTQAWLHLVHAMLGEFGPIKNSDEFLNAQTQLLSTRAVLFFYSRDRIMSAEAKRTFVPPDLAPFPKSLKTAHLKP